MLTTTILSIGDEILIGQIMNSNSKWMAERLTPIGCGIQKISTIGDGRDVIVKELDSLLEISDLLIITGGLGPTHDDITKQVLCDYFGDELIYSEDWLRKIEEQFKHRGIALSDRNKEQALIPSRSKILFNRIGTAPGMYIQSNGKHIISLPGVPQEMICIMNEVALPLISELTKGTAGGITLYANIQTHGIPESTLADLLEIDESFLGESSLAFLPSFRGVKLRIGAKGETHEKAEIEMRRISEHIINRADKNIISFDETPYPEILGNLLRKQNKTIAVAESCTAGLLGAALTSVGGASDYFVGGMITYSNESKNNQLGVDSAIIHKYGTVSMECANAMSRQARNLFKTDYAISITGIAGPNGGTTEKPVGTVWISIADNNGEDALMQNFGNAREMTRERAVQTAIVRMIKKLRQQ